MDMSLAFRKRLENEYKALQKIPENDMISVMPAPGEVIPYVRSYLVEYRVPTWVKDENGEIRIQERTVVRFEQLSISSGVRITIAEGKTPFHSNWYETGKYGSGIHRRSSNPWLHEWMEEIFRSLQFEPDIIDVMSCSNCEARDFYLENRDHSEMFPTGTRKFPKPELGETKIRMVPVNRDAE